MSNLKKAAKELERDIKEAAHHEKKDIEAETAGPKQLLNDKR